VPSVLSQCHEFKFSESYRYASEVRKAIFEGTHADSVLDVASDLEKQILAPRKKTLLHDYIEYVIQDDLNFYFSDAGYDDNCAAPVIEMFDQYKIEYLSLEEYNKQFEFDDAFIYNTDYLPEIAETKFAPAVAIEVFNILFGDREAMKTFNLLVANQLGERTNRCTYWPKWLERALFCREKGQCAICKSDLSSLYQTLGKLSIDHIVPIALNGVNDPTNLQILCQACNLQKLGNVVVTSNALPLYW
jgi:hypothetical protein